MFMNEVHWEIDKKLRDNLQVFVYPNMSEKSDLIDDSNMVFGIITIT